MNLQKLKRGYKTMQFIKYKINNKVYKSNVVSYKNFKRRLFSLKFL